MRQERIMTICKEEKEENIGPLCVNAEGKEVMPDSTSLSLVPQLLRGDHISENIKAYRRKNKLSQGEFGAFIGVTAQAVSKWEKRQSYPDILLLPALARLMDISVDKLISEPAEF